MRHDVAAVVPMDVLTESRDVNPLYRQVIVQSVFGLVFFVALVFLSAGTWTYWQGWLFLAVFAASTASFTIYMARYDEPLLERRLKAGPWYEQRRSQQIIVSLVFVAFFAFIVLPILDYRHGLSRVPAWVSILGNAIIILAYAGIFWVIKTNSWAASNVRVEAGQKVVDTGPYAYVRHPMYAFAVWLFVGMPLALGSWWSIALLILFLPVLLWRLLDEEKILARDLPGYTDYMQRVRYRLVPHVW
ncbi:MAG TPA: isoprenylcysteine carboxylmethyltransferase family protein [Gemmatimonadaceae bacterium]